jgi:hypothetical protein
VDGCATGARSRARSCAPERGRVGTGARDTWALVQWRPDKPSHHAPPPAQTRQAPSTPLRQRQSDKPKHRAPAHRPPSRPDPQAPPAPPSACGDDGQPRRNRRAAAHHPPRPRRHHRHRRAPAAMTARPRQSRDHPPPTEPANTTDSTDALTTTARHTDCTTRRPTSRPDPQTPPAPQSACGYDGQPRRNRRAAAHPPPGPANTTDSTEATDHDSQTYRDTARRHPSVQAAGGSAADPPARRTPATLDTATPGPVRRTPRIPHGGVRSGTSASWSGGEHRRHRTSPGGTGSP